MLLAYVDESNRGNFYGFAALVADEHATKSLTADLNAIVQQASIDFGIPATTEIHAHPLFHGSEGWALVPPRARVAIYRQIIEAICRHDVLFILRHVDSKRLLQRQESRRYPVRFPAEQVCFQHILQRVDRVAQARDTHALLIADNRSDRERHRERFATYQTEGTPGAYMYTTLDRLLDTVHFAPSHQSRMLQAADMLAFTYRRQLTVTERDARAERAMREIWGIILKSKCIYEAGGWP